MSGSEQESAFAAYNEVKQQKKKKRKAHLKLELLKGKDSEQTGLEKLNLKEDALWSTFVNNIEKTKPLSLSTPIIPFPNETNGTNEIGVDQDCNNVFLAPLSKRKKKRKSAVLNNSKEGKRVDKNFVNTSQETTKSKKMKFDNNFDDSRNSSFKCKLDKSSKLVLNKKKKKSLNLENSLKANVVLVSASKKKGKKQLLTNGVAINGKSKPVLDSEGSPLSESHLLSTGPFSPTPLPNHRDVDAAKKFSLNINPTIAALKLANASNVQIPQDSVIDAKNMLSWIINPIDSDDFFDHYWEKKPLHIAREDTSYFDGVMSVDDLELALQLYPMYFSKNVTVSAYQKGQRTTEDLQGRARPETVRDYFDKGHSIRVMNPQTFIPNVGKIVYTLQELFRCMVGVNSYLTPAGTQGFAPHYDDIEAFVLQLEGQKDWKVYPPRNEEETLPSYSSPNFSQDEIGEPALEVTLKSGDLLYFPRGWIHQARSVEEHHSLHITVSTYQLNTWADFFEKVIPAALEVARQEDVAFRQGLPIDYLNHLGIIHSESESADRTAIIAQASKLFGKLLEKCPWDAAADQLGKQFIHSSFPPPVVTENNRGKGEFFHFTPKSRVKLLTAYCLRLVFEDDSLYVYYNTDNSKEYQGEEAQAFEISQAVAPALEELIKSYPKFVKMKNLPLLESSQDDLVILLKELKQRGLLIVK